MIDSMEVSKYLRVKNGHVFLPTVDGVTFFTI